MTSRERLYKCLWLGMKDHTKDFGFHLDPSGISSFSLDADNRDPKGTERGKKEGEVQVFIPW